ncbi:hypothetical protein ACOSQ4_022409 [Xanthoceras sorbifolium]
MSNFELKFIPDSLNSEYASSLASAEKTVVFKARGNNWVVEGSVNCVAHKGLVSKRMGNNFVRVVAHRIEVRDLRTEDNKGTGDTRASSGFSNSDSYSLKRYTSCPPSSACG